MYPPFELVGSEVARKALNIVRVLQLDENVLSIHRSGRE